MQYFKRVSQPGDVIVDRLQSTGTDKDYQVQVRIVTAGLPKFKSDLVECILPYWQHQDDLSAKDGIVFKGCRIVVHRALRKKCLQDLHTWQVVNTQFLEHGF